MARLKEYYRETVMPQLTKQFSYKSVMEVPRISKTVLNMGVGEAVGDKKLLDNAVGDMQKISGQIAQIPQRDLREVAGMNAFFIIPTTVKQRTAELFMDHPPLEKRLAALAEIAREMGRPVA